MFARWVSGVTPATWPPDIQWSSVHQVDRDKCFWSYSEWIRSAVDTALWPSDRCSSNLYKGPRGIRNSEARGIDVSSSLLRVFQLFFAEIITLLVAETNRYYHDDLDRLDQGPSPQPDVTEAEMHAFLAITINVGHCIWDEMPDYWSRGDNFHTAFYGNAMPRDTFLHILRFLGRKL